MSKIKKKRSRSEPSATAKKTTAFRVEEETKARAWVVRAWLNRPGLKVTLSQTWGVLVLAGLNVLEAQMRAETEVSP